MFRTKPSAPIPRKKNTKHFAVAIVWPRALIEMPSPAQAEKAKLFLSLHQGPRILVLPNAWDVASARIFEDAGFPAIATTSSGIANSLGYPDGQVIGRDEMLEVVARIVRSVSVPVTADMEAGYGKSPEDMAATARGVVEAGAVGLNLEDAIGEGSGELFEIAAQQEKIRAMIEAAKKKGIDLVLNARTDIYLEEIGEASTRAERTIERLNAYRDAGAACLFAPGVQDAATIERLVGGVRGPLNILGRAGTPPVRELEKLGVARVSVGGGPMRVTMAVVSRIAKHLRDDGDFAVF
ncbi:MAG TPA: isocitrate lyase/phosphoenolpyruvate mutase family protein, partial [Candidatus Acidoferrales bacterium]|nr:isocitrate lyase/phosphoenolpyruvate mutase family protein [Candidatus Acidoferrales bacterium]